MPNTPTASNNQPFVLFGGYELEEPLGEQPNIFEEPTGDEEEEEPIPIELMVENQNNRGNRERELRVPSLSGKPTGTLR